MTCRIRSPAHKWKRAMRVPLGLLCAVPFLVAIPGYSQTAPTTPPSTAAPTRPASSAKAAPPEELQWSAVGATAQCQDGTFFHDRPSARACADHGGVRKWLQARDQSL